MDKIWNVFEIRPGVLHRLMIGTLLLYLKKDKNLMYTFSYPADKKCDYDHSSMSRVDDEILNPEWIEIITEKNIVSIEFAPVLPERPVVIENSRTCRITSTGKVSFFVSLPLSVRCVSGDKEAPDILFEIPSVLLSNTWFGDHYSGVLCYSYRRGFLSETRLPLYPFECICPVEIQKNSREIVDFKKICIYSQFLNLYKCDSAFYTDSRFVEFTGDDRMKINIPTPSLTDKNYSLAAIRRSEPDKSFLDKSLTLFKKYTGLQG